MRPFRTNRFSPVVRRLALGGLSIAVACSRAKNGGAQADSARMVDAALHEVNQSDSTFDKRCRGDDGELHRDTGQVPCRKTRQLQFRVVAYRPDSAGACVWLEPVIPAGERFLDGGPLPVPVTREGAVRSLAAMNDCYRDRPANER